MGLTKDVLFSPSERDTESKMTAATADDAEVDLKQWALPHETEVEARARVILGR